jgi:hypothetical protein
MKDEGLVQPIFSTMDLLPDQIPDPYRRFVELWNKEDRVEIQRAQTEMTAAQVNSEGGVTVLPTEVSRQMEEIGEALAKAERDGQS